MGSGEDYKYRWHDWYDQLTEKELSDYKTRFPPPEDKELCWYDFYELIADVPDDPDSIPDRKTP